MFRKFLSRFKVKSSEYWNNRYRQGGNSGQGSYGKLADFKKKVLDDFCKKNDIHSIIEFGSGDGNQISLLEYENVYIGLDISPAAIELCRQRFKNDKGKSFFVFSGKKGFCKQNGLTAELSLSLDVLYHLVEDKIFSNYMHELFSSAEKFVIIYSSNDENQKDSSWHVKHRNFSNFVESEFPQFTLLEHIPNEFPIGNPSGEESSADFFIYIRNNKFANYLLKTLENKTILLISQQAWGTMFVSKHHYAVELARRGNTVFFLNPPVLKKKNSSSLVEIIQATGYNNLYLVTNTLDFPYNIKFHLPGLFHFFIRRHIRKILKEINRSLDIVWSFDLAHVYPLEYFSKSSYKIFHPVDMPLNETGINAAKGAKVIFSTAKEILVKYASYKVPGFFINHGISNEFLLAKKHTKTDQTVRVGFSGNLLREDIDRPVFLQIIHENPGCIFECWGSYSANNTNVGGGSDDKTNEFIATLQMLENVILHGPVQTSLLADELQRMDVFLICYDLTAENRNGPNYHKTLEYISTGKIVISNYISVYEQYPQFVQMVNDPAGNSHLPMLFKKVIGDLDFYNSNELQAERVAFSLVNTYSKQVDRIDEILYTIMNKMEQN